MDSAVQSDATAQQTTTNFDIQYNTLAQAINVTCPKMVGALVKLSAIYSLRPYLSLAQN